MRLVLLWGTLRDKPFEAVRRALVERDIEPVILEQERAPEASVELSVAREVDGRLEAGGRTIGLDEVGAVYMRMYDTWRLLERAGYAPEGDEMRHALALDEALWAWLEIADARVVNRPAAMASNSSKPYQVELSRAQGFKVPETLVTTDPDEAREFVARHGVVVYKSLSSLRSIVSRVTDEAAARLDDVAWCPTQFQGYVPGVDYRVHVVGERIFACEIRSEADDYRYARRRGLAAEVRQTELPAEIAERCFALSRSLDLVFTGIDLRRTPEGEWYCFEVNPSPGFTYFEQAAGQPIAAAVADLLTAQ